MNADDPNLLLLESVAAPRARVTRDVDVIVEVLSLLEYHELERELERNRFKHDTRADAPVCRWLIGSCMLDVMPTDARILGFSNRWYAEAIRTAAPFQLPGRLAY